MNISINGTFVRRCLFPFDLASRKEEAIFVPSVKKWNFPSLFSSWFLSFFLSFFHSSFSRSPNCVVVVRRVPFFLYHQLATGFCSVKTKVKFEQKPFHEIVIDGQMIDVYNKQSLTTKEPAAATQPHSVLVACWIFGTSFLLFLSV